MSISMSPPSTPPMPPKNPVYLNTQSPLTPIMVCPGTQSYVTPPMSPKELICPGAPRKPGRK
jgi:hypothetical protein